MSKYFLFLISCTVYVCNNTTVCLVNFMPQYFREFHRIHENLFVNYCFMQLVIPTASSDCSCVKI